MVIKSGADVLPPRPRTAMEKAAELAKRSEAEKKLARCCFTGHSPQTLKRPIDDIKVDLENEILQSIKDGYTTFITGMAYGTDIWAGNIVVRLKDRFPDLKLIAAVPFPAFPDTWDEKWKGKYEKLLEKADLVKVISEEYREDVYQQRNIWMIDHSSKVITAYDSTAGETQPAIQYARKNGVFVKYLSPGTMARDGDQDPES